MAIWYVDPSISPAEESDSFDGGYGVGKLRDSWEDVTIAGNDQAYGRGNVTGVLPVNKSLLFSGTGNVLGSYGGGRHIIDGSAVTAAMYVVRFAGTDQRLENIVIVGAVAGTTIVQLGTATNNIYINNIKLIGQGASATVVENYGLQDFTLGSVTISNFEVSGVNTGLGLGGFSGDTTGLKVIEHGLIYSLSGTKIDACDGITIGGTVRDHGYKTIIRRLNISGFYENGIDLTGARRCIVEDCLIHTPVKSAQTTVGVMFGNVAGSQSEHIARRVMSVGCTQAFSARGGAGNELTSCVGIGELNGFVIGNGVEPSSQVVRNCVMVGGNAGIRVTNTPVSFNHIITNTVLLAPVGLLVDSGCSAQISSCAAESVLYSGAGTITDGGGNITGGLLLGNKYRPLPSSPCLTSGADLGYLRDMEGKQCKKHIGAYGYARLATK